MKFLKNAILSSSVILSNEVFAAGSSDWIKPGVSLVEDVEVGLVDLAIMAIGIGLVAAGIIGGITGRLDWGKIGTIVAAGLIVTAGPAGVRILLAASQS